MSNKLVNKTCGCSSRFIKTLSKIFLSTEKIPENNFPRKKNRRDIKNKRKMRKKKKTCRVVFALLCLCIYNKSRISIVYFQLINSLSVSFCTF